MAHLLFRPSDIGIVCFDQVVNHERNVLIKGGAQQIFLSPQAEETLPQRDSQTLDG